MAIYKNPVPEEPGDSQENKIPETRQDGIQTEPYETLDDLQAVAGTADEEQIDEALGLEAEGKPEEDDLESDEEF